MKRMSFEVDPDLWHHLRFVTGKDDLGLIRHSLACLKWAMDESAKGRKIGSYGESGEIKSTLTDEAFDKARAALTSPSPAEEG